MKHEVLIGLRGGECSLDGPAVSVKACLQSGEANPKSFSPFRQAVRLTFVGDSSVVVLVAALLALSAPATIGEHLTAHVCHGQIITKYGLLGVGVS